MYYNKKDYYYKRAKREHYLSRAAYKLLEMNKRYHIIRRGMKVLDVGCAPGGWSQVALNAVGRKGLVVGFDIEKVELNAPNFRFVQGDLFQDETWNSAFEIAKGPFQVILSDAAPKTTGIAFKDVSRSLEMCSEVIRRASKHLVHGGWCVLKVFEGEGFAEFKKELKEVFLKVKIYKPIASRTMSRETYLILQGFTGRDDGA